MNAHGATIQVRLNGEPQTIPAGQPLPELIVSLGLPPQATLVEHNGQALFRADWAGVQLGEGDRLEILRVVAGG